MIGRLLRRRSILSDREQELRAREGELLDRLAAALERFGADVAAGDLQRFREAREQLNGLFLLVIAGEFNSGKSSFINALLGERVLPEGVTPTTDRINLLRHGPTVSEQQLESFLLERTHPAELLREITMVDTPGTNAIIRRHEELTRDFVPRSDLVLFVTSADRPFTESERTFLEQIREWGKKIVFVINKVDILTDRGGPASRSSPTSGRTPPRCWARRRRSFRCLPGWPWRRARKGDERALGAERLRRDRGIPAPHAGPGGAGPPQAAEPAERRAAARGTSTRRPRSSGSSSWPRTSRRCRTSTGSSPCSIRGCCATSSHVSPGWISCSARWSRGGFGSSRRPSASAGSGPCWTARRVKRSFEREVIGDTPAADRGGGGPDHRLDRGAESPGLAGRQPLRRPPPPGRSTRRG